MITCFAGLTRSYNGRGRGVGVGRVVDCTGADGVHEEITTHSTVIRKIGEFIFMLPLFAYSLVSIIFISSRLKELIALS